MSQRADYGIDAPYVVIANTAGAAAAVGFALGEWPLLRSHHQSLALALGGWSLFGAAICLAQAGWMILGSKRGKLRERDMLLDAFSWRGDEHVLDVGCGRGLLLIGAVKRAPHGPAASTSPSRLSLSTTSADGGAARRRRARSRGCSGRAEE